MNIEQYILRQIIRTELRELYTISKDIPKKQLIQTFELENELNPRIEMFIKMISRKYNLDEKVVTNYLLKLSLISLISD